MENEIVPIFDPDRPFRVWSINEIYDGVNTGSYVPNIDDAVWDWDTGLYKVVYVNIETGISTLQRYQPIIENPFISEEDILIGAVPGRVCESFRLYLNNKTDPINAAIDSRLYIYGSDNKYIRLFKGFNIGKDGDVISLYYNSDNELLDDKIPLELAATISDNNKTIKSPIAAYASRGLEDGEAVTCVVYSDTGIVTSINPLLVKNTGFIKGVDSSNSYITQISLKSPFLSNTNSSLLEVPLNTPIDNLNLSADITYSGGSRKNCLIDNKKITISGVEQFKTSMENQSISVVLTYHFSENETNYSATSDDGRSMSKVYQMTTVAPMSKGVVKIFVIPIFNDIIKGWDLDYYLYNLDKDTSLKVTDSVKVIEPAGQGYEPINFGNLQTLKLSLNLKDIDDLNVDYIHYQDFEITLFSLIGVSIPAWTMCYKDSGLKVYGEIQFARVSKLNDKIYLDLSNNYNTLNSWLDSMYRSVYPLVNQDETDPLTPTHVIIEYKDILIEMIVVHFDKPMEIPIIPIKGDTILCKWIKRLEAKDLQLAITPLTVIRDF